MSGRVHVIAYIIQPQRHQGIPLLFSLYSASFGHIFEESHKEKKDSKPLYDHTHHGDLEENQYLRLDGELYGFLSFIYPQE